GCAVASGGTAGAHVGAAGGGDQRRADAVAADVGQRHHPVAVGDGLPVVIVAAGLVCGAVPAGDVEAGDVRGRAGQQRALDGAGDDQVALEAVDLPAGLGLGEGRL